MAATGQLSKLVPDVVATTAPVEPAPASQPAPAAPTEVPATPAPVAADPAGGEIPEAGEASDGKSKRFRFSSDEDQAIAQIAKARGVSLLTAADIYKGSNPAPAGTAPVAAPAAPEQDAEVIRYDSQITETQERIKTLTAERKVAADDMDSDKGYLLSDQIAEANAELRLLKNGKQGHLTNREQAAQSQAVQSVNAARDRVFAEFPVFADETRMERLALDSYVTRAINDPARKAEFKDPNWPEKLAREFATAQGIKPGSAPAGTAPAPAPAVRPLGITKTLPQQITAPVGARLLTGADGGKPPLATRQMTSAELKTLISTNPEARREIVRNLTKLSGGRR